ncbi:MAG: VOC family protein [Rhodobacteraceae bacterium]|nr:VOC family protein [Paracoccaceae bacterium]
MTHRSRLGVIVIDCEGDDLTVAMRFWSGALGRAFYPDPEDPRYAASDTPSDEPHLILQKVGHPSRVHLDIETDDREAERARLEALGARLVERHAKGFVIMEAPTGQRFCLVGPQRPDFAVAAREVG